MSKQCFDKNFDVIWNTRFSGIGSARCSLYFITFVSLYLEI